MALKCMVGQKLMNEVIKQNKKSGKEVEWRVLVVDQLGMRMLSSCCKMHEISAEGITIVEDLLKQREPLPSMEAVYLITPSEKSINALKKDFENPSRPMYRAAHVFFTEACPDELFNPLIRHKVAKFIKTLKEINISFVAQESQVFSLDMPETFKCYYNPTPPGARLANMERIAEQIATLCATLGEYPSVRFRADYERNAELAQIVQKKLDAYKADDPTMGEGVEKAKSQLIILDRGFDCISPVLHELTYQAMAYDLLPINNDVYKCAATSGTQEKDVLLDENDELWVELIHEHIHVVLQSITKKMKQFVDSKNMSQADKQSMRDLSTMIKKMPQFQKELSKYSTHSQLASDCLNRFKAVEKLIPVEQDLATGIDLEGEHIKDHMRNMVPVLLDPDISDLDKMRIIILYVISKDGLSEENLNKVVQHAQLLPEQKQAIIDLSYLGLNSVVHGDRKKIYQIPRNPKNLEYKYDKSRWTPLVKDVMENCINDTLDLKHFPFLAGRAASNGYQVPISARYGNWHRGGQAPLVRNVPRLIVFIIGGVSFSEMRCAYEVSKAVKNWEVIIGSSNILTPEGFLKNLLSLSS